MDKENAPFPFFSSYGKLLMLLQNVYEEYEKESKNLPDLKLPTIPKDSIVGMLFLFPYLAKKYPTFYIDADLACVSVTFLSQREHKITIVAKNSRFLLLSKIGDELGESRLPFRLSSTLKLPNTNYFQKLEEILSYL